MTTNRIWQVLKLDLLINKKGVMALVGGLAFGYFIALFFVNVIGESSVDNSAATVLPMTLVSIVFSGVTMFSSLKTKQQRATYLMIPASVGEKFVSRLIVTTLGVMLMVVVALAMADVLRWIAHILLQRGSGGSVVASTLTFIVMQFEWKEVTSLTLVVIWAQSIYILGSAFFRRHAWFLTTAVMFVLTMLVSGAITYGAYRLMDIIDFDEYEVNETALFGWSVVVLTVLTLVNYWLSYRIFSRMQVINNKWVNL